MSSRADAGGEVKDPKWTVVLFLLTLTVAFCTGISFFILIDSNGEGLSVFVFAVEVSNLSVMSWIVSGRVLHSAPPKTREAL